MKLFRKESNQNLSPEDIEARREKALLDASRAAENVWSIVARDPANNDVFPGKQTSYDERTGKAEVRYQLEPQSYTFVNVYRSDTGAWVVESVQDRPDYEAGTATTNNRRIRDTKTMPLNGEPCLVGRSEYSDIDGVQGGVAAEDDMNLGLVDPVNEGLAKNLTASLNELAASAVIHRSGAVSRPE